MCHFYAVFDTNWPNYRVVPLFETSTSLLGNPGSSAVMSLWRMISDSGHFVSELLSAKEDRISNMRVRIWL